MLEIFSYSFLSYPTYGNTSDLALLWEKTINWSIRYAIVAVPFVIGSALLLSRPFRNHEWLGIVLQALFGLAGVYAQRRLWDYHWISTLPYMSLIAVYAAFTLTKVPGRRAIIWVLTEILCLVLAWPVLTIQQQTFAHVGDYLSGQSTWLEYLQEFGGRDVIEAAAYVQYQTSQDEPIYIWGHCGMIYYLAERRNPTRFTVDPPLSLRHSRQMEWQSETIRDLRAQPPSYILVVTHDTTPFEPLASKEQLASFSALADLIADEYTYDRTIGGFEIYARERPLE